MFDFFKMICVFAMVIPAAVGNIIFYPISKKISLKISDYISQVLAPRLFAVLDFFWHFKFWDYKDLKKSLPQQFLVISNHQSFLDIAVFLKFFHGLQMRFVAKDTLGRHIPLISEMLRVQEHCLIPRKAKPMEAMKTIEKFGDRVMKRRQIPLIFPEGTRTKDGNVGKFNSAGFRKLSEVTGLPVVVCALDGGYKLRDLKNFVQRLKAGCYRVKVLKIYDAPKTKEECASVLEAARQIIQNQIVEWRAVPALAK